MRIRPVNHLWVLAAAFFGASAGCGDNLPFVPDDVTAPACGDGLTDSDEDCDDGEESAACNADCTFTMCGDGMTNAAAGEDCDDGGESAACNADCTVAACGDGTVNAAAGEDCDDGNTADGDGCSAACKPESAARCGDGVVTVLTGEQCDDGNTADGDGCSATCLLDPFVTTGPVLVSGTLSCNPTAANTGRKISVDALGTFYVAMNCGGEVSVAASTDRSVTYGPPVGTGITGAAEVAIEGGPAGTAYAAAVLTAGQLVFSRTDDSGATWSAPAVLADGPVRNVVSLDSSGDTVMIAVSGSEGLRVFTNTNGGEGEFQAVDVTMPSIYHDLILDKTNGDVYLVSDNPLYHIRRSTDGGMTFGDEHNPSGTAYFSDWAGSRGRIYVVGTYMDSEDIEIISVDDLGTSTEVLGLPAVAGIAPTRSIDADGAGNAYVATQLDEGGIQLDRMVFDSGEIRPDDVRAVSATGQMPGVAGLPSYNGAAVVYTDGTEVYVSVQVYAECGNGMLEDTETCDDGNTDAGDGCDAACQVEP